MGLPILAMFVLIDRVPARANRNLQSIQARARAIQCCAPSICVPGRSALARSLGDFLAGHPLITASLLLVDRVVDLVEEGLDVAIRVGQLPDSGSIARRVGGVRRIVVASPIYLERRAEPKTPADLVNHSIISFTGTMPNGTLALRDADEPLHIPLQPIIEINDATAALALAEAGYGITSLYCYVAGASIRADRLKPVLAGYWPAAAPVHIVYPDARLLAAKVRAYVDWTAPRLAEQLTRLSALA